MAIIKSLGISTGTFAPAMPSTIEDRSSVEHKGGSSVYKIDLRFQNINPEEHIKWCRRNLGDRGSTWDFWLVNRMLYIEVWGHKERFAYEMWKN